MKALAIVFALFLVAMPITAGPVELPATGILDQIYSWFTAVWEAMGSLIVLDGLDGHAQEMGPLIDPLGSPEVVDPDGPPHQEMGPLIDPLG